MPICNFFFSCKFGLLGLNGCKGVQANLGRLIFIIAVFDALLDKYDLSMEISGSLSVLDSVHCSLILKL